MIPLRDLQRQYHALQSEIDQAVAEVLASGNYILGKTVEALERELADYAHVAHCITCASGTDALRLALMALGIKQGDAVLLPDFTFFATAEAVASVGATPVFVDVSPTYYTLSPLELETTYRALCEQSHLRPAAVVAVDLFGTPAPYDEVLAFCRRHNLPLISDSAQGFGSTFRGRPSQSLADISTTSFFPSKPLGCYGDGGAIFTNEASLAHLLRSLRAHGRSAGDKYLHEHIGLNSRLDAVQAAVLRVKLRHFDDELRAANRLAGRYCEAFAPLSDILHTPHVPPLGTSAWANYTLRLDSQRDKLQADLAAAGIASAVYYPHTLSNQPAFAHLGQKPCAVAEQLTHQLLSLPFSPYMTDDEADTVIRHVKLSCQSL